MECSDHVQSNNQNASCSVEVVQGEVRCSSLTVNLLFGRVMKILPTKFNSLQTCLLCQITNILPTNLILLQYAKPNNGV